jgi:thiol-disulfide isomerase/thioredoxin
MNSIGSVGSGSFPKLPNNLTNLSSSFSGLFSNKLLLFLGLVFLGFIIYVVYSSIKFTKTVYNDNGTTPTDASSGAKEAELMIFSVDWCPHCKTAKPEWEKVKSEYSGKQVNGYNLLFTEINCTNESPQVTKLMDQFKIEGYPTIKMVKDGQVIEFDAKPTYSNLTQFLNTAI